MRCHHLQGSLLDSWCTNSSSTHYWNVFVIAFTIFVYPLNGVKVPTLYPFSVYEIGGSHRGPFGWWVGLLPQMLPSMCAGTCRNLVTAPLSGVCIPMWPCNDPGLSIRPNGSPDLLLKVSRWPTEFIELKQHLIILFCNNLVFSNSTFLNKKQ